MPKNKHSNDSPKEMYRQHEHFKSRFFIYLCVGIGLILVGLVIDRILSRDIDPSLKYIFSMIFPVTGATIIAQVLPFFFSKLPCNDCEVKQKISDDRWCRWLGPISKVLPKRSEDFLTEFFKDAKEIDIVTPNLYEVYDRALSTLKKSNARIRMMSLHPECSAVYRRFNDMGPSEGIRSRGIYSSLIREALEELQKERFLKKNWEIRTYTLYPVLTIFRADNRFLLGFPLRGCRVRDQFHIELTLPQETIETLDDYEAKGKKLNPDIRLGAGIRSNLIRHFDLIWEGDKDIKKKASKPWVSRVEIFRKMLDISLNFVGSRNLIKKNDAKLKDLIRLFLIIQYEDDRSKQKKLIDIDKSLDHVRTNGDSIIEEVKKQYHVNEDNVCKSIFNNFLEIISDIFKVIIDIGDMPPNGQTHDYQIFIKKIIEKITEILSHGISSGRYEFEDCSELLFVLRNKDKNEEELIPASESHIWKKIWDNLEMQAENWSR